MSGLNYYITIDSQYRDDELYPLETDFGVSFETKNPNAKYARGKPYDSSQFFPRCSIDPDFSTFDFNVQGGVIKQVLFQDTFYIISGVITPEKPIPSSFILLNGGEPIFNLSGIIYYSAPFLAKITIGQPTKSWFITINQTPTLTNSTTSASVSVFNTDNVYFMFDYTSVNQGIYIPSQQQFVDIGNRFYKYSVNANGKQLKQELNYSYINPYGTKWPPQDFTEFKLSTSPDTPVLGLFAFNTDGLPYEVNNHPWGYHTLYTDLPNKFSILPINNSLLNNNNASNCLVSDKGNNVIIAAHTDGFSPSYETFAFPDNIAEPSTSILRTNLIYEDANYNQLVGKPLSFETDYNWGFINPTDYKGLNTNAVTIHVCNGYYSLNTFGSDLESKIVIGTLYTSERSGQGISQISEYPTNYGKQIVWAQTGFGTSVRNIRSAAFFSSFPKIDIPSFMIGPSKNPNPIVVIASYGSVTLSSYCELKAYEVNLNQDLSNLTTTWPYGANINCIASTGFYSYEAEYVTVRNSLMERTLNNTSFYFNPLISSGIAGYRLLSTTIPESPSTDVLSLSPSGTGTIGKFMSEFTTFQSYFVNTLTQTSASNFSFTIVAGATNSLNEAASTFLQVKLYKYDILTSTDTLISTSTTLKIQSTVANPETIDVSLTVPLGFVDLEFTPNYRIKVVFDVISLDTNNSTTVIYYGGQVIRQSANASNVSNVVLKEATATTLFTGVSTYTGTVSSYNYNIDNTLTNMTVNSYIQYQNYVVTLEQDLSGFSYRIVVYTLDSVYGFIKVAEYPVSFIGNYKMMAVINDPVNWNGLYICVTEKYNPPSPAPKAKFYYYNGQTNTISIITSYDFPGKFVITDVSAFVNESSVYFTASANEQSYIFKSFSNPDPNLIYNLFTIYTTINNGSSFNIPIVENKIGYLLSSSSQLATSQIYAVTNANPYQVGYITPFNQRGCTFAIGNPKVINPISTISINTNVYGSLYSVEQSTNTEDPPYMYVSYGSVFNDINIVSNHAYHANTSITSVNINPPAPTSLQAIFNFTYNDPIYNTITNFSLNITNTGIVYLYYFDTTGFKNVYITSKSLNRTFTWINQTQQNTLFDSTTNTLYIAFSDNFSTGYIYTWTITDITTPIFSEFVLNNISMINLYNRNSQIQFVTFDTLSSPYQTISVYEFSSPSSYSLLLSQPNINQFFGAVIITIQNTYVLIGLTSNNWPTGIPPYNLYLTIFLLDTLTPILVQDIKREISNPVQLQRSFCGYSFDTSTQKHVILLRVAAQAFISTVSNNYLIATTDGFSISYGSIPVYYDFGNSSFNSCSIVYNSYNSRIYVYSNCSPTASNIGQEIYEVNTVNPTVILKQIGIVNPGKLIPTFGNSSYIWNTINIFTIGSKLILSTWLNPSFVANNEVIKYNAIIDITSPEFVINNLTYNTVTQTIPTNGKGTAFINKILNDGTSDWCTNFGDNNTGSAGLGDELTSQSCTISGLTLSTDELYLFVSGCWKTKCAVVDNNGTTTQLVTNLYNSVSALNVLVTKCRTDSGETIFSLPIEGQLNTYCTNPQYIDSVYSSGIICRSGNTYVFSPQLKGDLNNPVVIQNNLTNFSQENTSLLGVDDNGTSLFHPAILSKVPLTTVSGVKCSLSVYTDSNGVSKNGIVLMCNNTSNSVSFTDKNNINTIQSYIPFYNSNTQSVLIGRYDTNGNYKGSNSIETPDDAVVIPISLDKWTNSIGCTMSILGQADSSTVVARNADGSLGGLTTIYQQNIVSEQFIFSTPGLYTFVPPTGTLGMVIKCWGAGGQMGYANGWTNVNKVCGGGGGYASSYLTINGSPTFNIGVGESGKGGMSTGYGITGSAGGGMSFVVEQVDNLFIPRAVAGGGGGGGATIYNVFATTPNFDCHGAPGGTVLDIPSPYGGSAYFGYNGFGGIYDNGLDKYTGGKNGLNFPNFLTSLTGIYGQGGGYLPSTGSLIGTAGGGGGNGYGGGAGGGGTRNDVGFAYYWTGAVAGGGGGGSFGDITIASTNTTYPFVPGNDMDIDYPQGTETAHGGYKTSETGYAYGGNGYVVINCYSYSYTGTTGPNLPTINSISCHYLSNGKITDVNNQTYSHIALYDQSTGTDLYDAFYPYITPSSSGTVDLTNYYLYIQGAEYDPVLNQNFSVRSNYIDVNRNALDCLLNKNIAVETIDRRFHSGPTYYSNFFYNCNLSKSKSNGLINFSFISTNIILATGSVPITDYTKKYYLLTPSPTGGNMIITDIVTISPSSGLSSIITLSTSEGVTGSYGYLSEFNQNALYNLQFYPGSLLVDQVYTVQLHDLVVPNRRIRNSQIVGGYRYLTDFRYIFVQLYNARVDENGNETSDLTLDTVNNFYINNPIGSANKRNIYTGKVQGVVGGSNFVSINTSNIPRIKFVPNYYTIRIRLIDPYGHTIIFDNTVDSTNNGDSIFAATNVVDNSLMNITADLIFTKFSV